MKIRRHADGTVDGECNECGNGCLLVFRRGRWLCEFCLQSDFMIAEFAREDRRRWGVRLLVAVDLLLLLSLPFLR